MPPSHAWWHLPAAELGSRSREGSERWPRGLQPPSGARSALPQAGFVLVNSEGQVSREHLQLALLWLSSFPAEGAHSPVAIPACGL